MGQSSVHARRRWPRPVIMALSALAGGFAKPGACSDDNDIVRLGPHTPHRRQEAQQGPPSAPIAQNQPLAFPAASLPPPGMAQKQQQSGSDFGLPDFGFNLGVRPEGGSPGGGGSQGTWWGDMDKRGPQGSGPNNGPWPAGAQFLGPGMSGGGAQIPEQQSGFKTTMDSEQGVQGMSISIQMDGSRPGSGPGPGSGMSPQMMAPGMAPQMASSMPKGMTPEDMNSLDQLISTLGTQTNFDVNALKALLESVLNNRMMASTPGKMQMAMSTESKSSMSDSKKNSGSTDNSVSSESAKDNENADSSMPSDSTSTGSSQDAAADWPDNPSDGASAADGVSAQSTDGSNATSMTDSATMEAATMSTTMATSTSAMEMTEAPSSATNATESAPSDPNATEVGPVDPATTTEDSSMSTDEATTEADPAANSEDPSPAEAGTDGGEMNVTLEAASEEATPLEAMSGLSLSMSTLGGLTSGSDTLFQGESQQWKAAAVVGLLLMVTV